MVPAKEKALPAEDQSSTAGRRESGSSSLQYGQAIAVGLVITVVGTVLLEQIVFVTHYYMLGLAYIGLGYAVGTAVERVGKQPGLAQALPAAATVVMIQVYGYVLLANDVAHKHTHDMLHRPHAIALHALPPNMLPIAVISLIGSAGLAFRTAMGDGGNPDM